LIAWLRNTCRLSSPTAAQRVEIARALPSLPDTEQAFRSGDIGYQHAAVIARTATEVGPERIRSAESVLVESARRLDPGRLRLVTRHLRHCIDPNGALDAANADHEGRRVHLSQTFDGVFVLDGVLDAEGGALLRTALNALTGPARGDERNPGQRRADALVELATRQLQNGSLPSAAGQRPHLTMTVSRDTLRREPRSPGADLAWAGPVVADLARRLACDAALTTVTVSSEGQPLDVGRETRTIPPAIRRALVVRDRGCRHPGCDRPPEWTDAHHITHWVDGGETRLENLILLCRAHHRAVHEGRSTLDGSHRTFPSSGEPMAEPP